MGGIWYSSPDHLFSMSLNGMKVNFYRDVKDVKLVELSLRQTYLWLNSCICIVLCSLELNIIGIMLHSN